MWCVTQWPFPACLPRPIGRGPTSASANTVKTDRPGRDETLSAERVNKAALYDTPDFLHFQTKRLKGISSAVRETHPLELIL